MSILYLLTSPQPVIEGTDAVFKEVKALQAVFNGAQINLFPFSRPSSLFPKTLYGLQRIKTIRNQESQLKINHIFVSTLQYLPLFYCLKRPIVYTVVASLQQQKKPGNIKKLNTLHRIVISNERDQQVLKSWGINNYSIIRPGINTSGFFSNPLQLKKELTLLLASAPWEKAQFYTKGTDLLLKATAELPFLKVILLWRGLFFKELLKKINYYGVMQKVEVINQKVNVNDFLKRVHATILLAKRPDLVKAFPHSLIESLAAGKPVIVSKTIPMADYVTKHGCGVIVNALRTESLTDSISTLMSRYQQLARNTSRVTERDFSLGQMIEQYRKLYRLEIKLI